MSVPNPEALQAIANADLIVLGPGDLFTSVIPNLLVTGIPGAIASSKAKKVYVVNLMTKFGQTYGFTAADHLQTIQKYIGKSVDAVVINTAPLQKSALTVYAKYHEFPVKDDIDPSQSLTVIRADVASRQETLKSKSDSLVRSLIRHDSQKLAQYSWSIFLGSAYENCTPNHSYHCYRYSYYPHFITKQ